MSKTYTFFQLLFLSLFAIQISQAQTGCPGCAIDLPTLPEDTIYLGTVASGEAFAPFDEDLSFRMPKSTTPVNALDPSVPAGLNIDEIEIISLTNLPPGLNWEPNQISFDTQSETDGCIKLCGTPLAPGVYDVEVNLAASISIITQQATFTFLIEILPETSANGGFSMDQSAGCESVTVEFTNNIPSGGIDGFFYNWDFGNGTTSTDENPGSITFDQPGTYFINYEVIIDTVGFILQDVEALTADCDDIPTAPAFSNDPDLFLVIKDPSGMIVYQSDVTDNMEAPIDWQPGILLEDGDYVLEVKDDDSGINGGDDLCGTITFTKNDDGLQIDGDFEVELTILHPLSVQTFQDTVLVYELPETPSVSIASNEFCEGDSVLLFVTSMLDIQWFLDSQPIPGATDATYYATTGGEYQVLVTNEDGCSSPSFGELITVIDAPETPAYVNDNNLLFVFDESTLPVLYSLQWFQDGSPLVGENGLSYCATTTGVYGLGVTDLETGCTAFFDSQVLHDDQFDCTVSSNDLDIAYGIEVFPNPMVQEVTIQLETLSQQEVQIQFFDVRGNLLRQGWKGLVNGTLSEQFDVSQWPQGLYLMDIQIGNERWVEQLIK